MHDVGFDTVVRTEEGRKMAQVDAIPDLLVSHGVPANRESAVELARSGNQGSQVGLSTEVHDGESSNVVDGLADLGQLLAAVRADRC